MEPRAGGLAPLVRATPPVAPERGGLVDLYAFLTVILRESRLNPSECATG